jgi:hypothetical protein
MSDFRFTVSPEAIPSFHDNGIVVLHTGKGNLFASNATGAHIWRCIEQRLSLEAIVHQIIDVYQTTQDTARKHVVGFLAELERNSLIERGAAL